MRLAERLKKGDKIALVAPAGHIILDKFKKAVEIVESLGFKPVWSDKIHKKWGYLAGKDEIRVKDLIDTFLDPEIKGIFAVRGGYGSIRILDKIHYQIIKRNPKVFLGFSDITALQLAFYKKTRLVSFHTSLLSLENEYTKDIFLRMIVDAEPIELDFNTDFTPEPVVINHGKAQGILIGGNLTLISSLVGTEYLPKFKNKIVFLEDVNEPPYKIDRMLTQLLMATDLRAASAIVLGIFHKCKRSDFYKNINDSLSLLEVFEDRLGNLGIPVIAGFPLGHINKISILPLGAEVNLDTESLKIKLIKPVVK